MIDWPEFRLRVQLWLQQSWPFRGIAWVRLRRHPVRDPALQDVITYLQKEIARLDKEKIEADTTKLTISAVESPNVAVIESLKVEVDTPSATPQLRQQPQSQPVETSENSAMGKSGALRSAIPEAAQTLMLQDTADGRRELPDNHSI